MAKMREPNQHNLNKKEELALYRLAQIFREEILHGVRGVQKLKNYEGREIVDALIGHMCVHERQALLPTMQHLANLIFRPSKLQSTVIIDAQHLLMQAFEKRGMLDKSSGMDVFVVMTPAPTNWDLRKDGDPEQDFGETDTYLFRVSTSGLVYIDKILREEALSIIDAASGNA